MPQPPLYSLLTSELETLQEFLDEHLNMGIIKASQSPHGVLILFICKKDGLLWLCMVFWAQNKVTKKDCYSLPLILDLLDASQKACVYTKIDLWHVYHLIQITEGEEWILES